MKAKISGFDSLSIGSTEIIPDTDGVVEIPEGVQQDPDFIRWVEEIRRLPGHSFEIVDESADQTDADAPAEKGKKTEKGKKA